jgi:hypothetical protein
MRSGILGKALVGLILLAGWPAPSQGVEPMPKLDIQLAVEVRPAPGKDPRWEILANLTIINQGTQAVALDKLSIAFDGELHNHVFQIQQRGHEIEYRGEMVKRAPPGPSGFLKLQPGKAYQQTVPLQGHYAFPPAGGEFTIRFDTFNHFSKDALQLTSNEAAFVLK